MKSLPWNSLITRLQQISWALFLLLLPITSFPFFPKALGGEALVRPLSLFPLLALLLLVTLPRLWQRPLPRSLLPLLAFTLVAIVSSLLALLRGIEPTLGVPIGERLLRAFITLGIGAAIYLSIALYVDSPETLRRSQRWVYAGFTIALLWGAVQALYVVHFNQRYFDLINRLQKFLSTRTLFSTRVSGMTYEPNWFAEQITFLLLPWLVASVLTGHSAFNWRWRWLRLEWFLLALALAVLPFTSSRAGILVLVALLAVGLLFFRPRLPRRSSATQPAWKKWLLRLSAVSVAAALLAGFLLVAGSKNIFFSRIWSYWSEIQDKSLASYIEYIGFGPRFIYAETGFRVYQAYPVLGVGLGNYAFYFDQMLPDRPLALQPEVLRLVTPGESGGRLITTKNLFVRLLAETGLLGTAVFLAFVIAIAGEAIFLLLTTGPPSRDRLRDHARYWGIAGSLGLVAFLLLTFSFDSFALPNMWVVFGFITAARAAAG